MFFVAIILADIFKNIQFHLLQSCTLQKSRQLTHSWQQGNVAATVMICFFSLQLQWPSLSVLSHTGRRTSNMCVARSVWRWDTGPTNARGSGNTCTDRQEQLRWKRNSRRMKTNPSASLGKVSPSVHHYWQERQVFAGFILWYLNTCLRSQHKVPVLSRAKGHTVGQKVLFFSFSLSGNAVVACTEWNRDVEDRIKYSYFSAHNHLAASLAN